MRFLRTLIVVLIAALGCGKSSSRLEVHSIASRELARTLDYGLLAPPPHTGEGQRFRHLFYLLHGFGDDHRALDRFGVSDTLYAAMSAARIPRAHIVTPAGERGFYINWHDGTHDYEDYILREVLPAAEKRLGIEVDRQHRHLIGVSMGGLGAVQIGLRHPELFASMASLSGVFPDDEEAEALVRSSPINRYVELERVFGDCSDRAFFEAHNPFWVARRRGPDLGQKLFLAVGDDERALFADTNAALHELLEQIGIPHEYLVYEGGHGWRHWAPIIERAMRYAVE
jgi:enterochelin esterase-like enzyme